NAKFSPGPQQMLTGRETRLVRLLAQIGRLREQIHSVKVFNLCASTNVPGNDVSCLYGINSPDWQPGVIGRIGRRALATGKRMLFENALNRSFAGQWFDFQLNELAPNGACPDQANISRLKFLAQVNHQTYDLRGGFSDRQRRARAVRKVSLRIAVENRPPFIKPLRGSLQVTANIFSLFTIQA